MKGNLWLYVSIMLSLGGTLFLFIAWKEWNNTLSILQNGVKTQGFVLENVHRGKRIGEIGLSTSLAPVIQFQTTEGYAVKFYSQVYTTPASYAIGEMIDIWYMPNNPQKASLGGKDVWIFPIVFGIFGSAMCLIFYPSVLRSLFSFIQSKFKKNDTISHWS